MMTKSEQMDKLLETYGSGASGADIIAVVRQVFAIQLEWMPVLAADTDTETSTYEGSANAAFEAYIESHDRKTASGVDIRQWINQLFGINLDALSALEGKQISMFSKGRWMIQSSDDLFAVHTGPHDVDVQISATVRYVELTGSSEPPQALITDLSRLGYEYDSQSFCFRYADPAGKAVPDSFKGHTIKALLDAIREFNRRVLFAEG
ncbi:hypothetical protein [Paenibacillus sp. YIM B09110]|uniref:hypothetical protein n=1 Tax=Paenibacillus sp. YIM B09110 TaxID=3126102 RepID=UPI00301D74E4